MTAGETTSGEVTELLTQLIRNGCVNDGTAESGHERRSVDLLVSYLEDSPVELDVYEPAPGRASLVARLRGRDRAAPSLMLMGHTDVVPADASRWKHDPFGGEVVDGAVWGRGAVDMLNLVASMAVAMRSLAQDGFAPEGDLVFLAAADEEAGGRLGTGWLAEHHPDAIRTTYAVTELGGMRLPIGADGPVLPVTVAEKGPCRLTVTAHGRAGHGSIPLGTENAAVLAAEVVRRLEDARPPATVSPTWRQLVEGLRLGDEATRLLTDPAGLEQTITAMEGPLGAVVHACTHTTLSPTVLRAGGKPNTIPGESTVTVDVRLLPGDQPEDVERLVSQALADLSEQVTVELEVAEHASDSPVDTPLWDALARHASVLVPGSRTAPFLLPGSTDSRHLRRLGTTCYGFGLYSERVDFSDFSSMFHGDDEHIDQASLALTTSLWERLARDLLS